MVSYQTCDDNQTVFFCNNFVAEREEDRRAPTVPCRIGPQSQTVRLTVKTVAIFCLISATGKLIMEMVSTLFHNISI
jgi:hypothetical protein